MALRRTNKDLGYGDSIKPTFATNFHYFSDHGEGSYFPTHFADAKCKCGGREFLLLLDAEQGAAVRVCGKCGHDHAIGDSGDYLEDAELEDQECLCGSPLFEITVGVSLYRESEDVRWLYIGCRCPACGLAGCYGDWKKFEG